MYVIIDNGSYNIKAGYSTATKPLTVSNVLAKTKDGNIYIGNDYTNTNNHSGIIFKRPFDQGHLISWETQRPIWDYTLDKLIDSDDYSDHGLLLTETPFQLPQLSMNTDQIMFEEFGFGNYYRCVPQSLVPWTYNQLKDNDFSLIIDSGYSATWIVPVIFQQVYWKGVKKLPIGGKVMNGLLKEIISFRYYDISEEPVLINTIKESTNYMALDFNKLIQDKLNHSCEFVLPDFKTTTTGYVRTANSGSNDDFQSLILSDERFVVSETLYHPEILFDNARSLSQILQSAPIKNLSDLVVEAIMDSPEVSRPLLSQNICIVGGTSLLPNFSARLQSEIAKELPEDWKINIIDNEHQQDLVSWYGGKELCDTDIIEKIMILKSEYYEHGANWCQKQFGFRNIL